MDIEMDTRPRCENGFATGNDPCPPSLPPPRLAQNGLEALMAAVSGPIKEAHVIILH